MPAGGANLFGLSQFNNVTSFFDPSNPILPESVGWAVVVGFGAFFAIITLTLVWFDIKFAGHAVVSENFQTAGRAIKTGLISVDVVSHWTWSITLLQSSTVGFNWGIAGEHFARLAGDGRFNFSVQPPTVNYAAINAASYIKCPSAAA